MTRFEDKYFRSVHAMAPSADITLSVLNESPFPWSARMVGYCSRSYNRIRNLNTNAFGKYVVLRGTSVLKRGDQ
jgi:hypothetical protein